MSQLFYNYIAKELLVGYFKKYGLTKGSKYYLIIENESNRDKLKNALKEVSEEIEISGVYQGNGYNVKEEPYSTDVIKISEDLPFIIIGYDKTSTEDYLTTIRNSVGVANNKYENYAVIYLLSDSMLSSIITACQDLQSVGGPLHSNYIINDIKEKAKTKIPKDLERFYLYKHLSKISEYIEDGTCNLFDFEYALSALEDEEIRGHFYELEFFMDKTIYDSTFQPTDFEMQKRVENNHQVFRRVNDIMNQDDDSDKLKILQKFLDEKLSKKIVNNPNWKNVDFQEFIDSIERKSISANLELLDVTLPSSGLMTSLVYTYKGNRKKKSTSYIVICDESYAEYQHIDITFNKSPNMKSSNDIQSAGQVLKLKVENTFNKPKTIGLNDNHHDFYALKLPCNKSFFSDINQCFTISKKGEIVVAVPEEAESLSFGNGSVTTSIPFDNVVVWSSDMKLEVPVVADDSDQIEFEVDFGTQKVNVILKLHTAQPVPPARPGTIEGQYIDGEVMVDGQRRPVLIFWKKYLDWEQLFIDNQCTYIEYHINELTEQLEAEYCNLDLPDNVRDCLNDLYVYFRAHQTIPSLCHLNDELRQLYISYWNSIVNVLNSIPNSRCLTRKEYDITKLGIVSTLDKIYLSPFNPILVAYLLEYNLQYDIIEDSSFAKKLLSPFYLLPYIFFNNQSLRPYTDRELSEVCNWLCYEGVNSKPQERTNDITTRMVWSKMRAFIRHFSYLFQDKDCPIIISIVGFADDANVIKGLLEFIKKEYQSGVQKIELHEYVDNIMEESLFEKLNRLDSLDAIYRELEAQKIKIESKGEYTSQEIIHQLFTRVSFYKHQIDNANKSIGYSHIAFYKMDTGSSFIRQSTNEMRTELSFNGLISVPSTINKSGAYIIGYGSKGIKENPGYIYPMVSAINTLYANEQNEGNSVFSNNTCVAKWFKFGESDLLNSIYENANWVTFINPEVDINFFYNQKLYVVHYTDQYTINAKYDSITVTKHIRQYENMLRKSYEGYALSEDSFQHFNETMMNYFNCLNGSWMLSIVNKTEDQIREKMSIVAASIASLRFVGRNHNIKWIPISLEEILRVTGSIGLSQDYIFSKKTLGAKGAMSDDLLMMGLDSSDVNNLKIFFYPVEVKFSKNNSMSDKAGKQVSQTYKQLKEHLFGEGNFTKNIYRTFFATQFLTNAEKLNANGLLSDADYADIEQYRFDLLNLRYNLQPKLPVKEMGNAAVISFFSHAPHVIQTSIVDDVPVCEIHFSEKECFQYVAEPENEHLHFLENDIISIDSDTLEVIDNDSKMTKEDVLEQDIVIADVEDSEDDIIQQGIVLRQEVNESINPPVSKRGIKIIVGNTPSGNREVVFEPNNTMLVTHPNMAIIGTMGTGKTQFARSLIAQISKEAVHNIGQKPVGMLVFDYKGDYKDKEFLNAVGGSCYKFKYPFNPLKLVVNDEVEGMNLPAITADRISDSFAKAYGLGLKQQSNIKQVILDTYADAGITRDSSSWNNPVPTMEQVIDKYFEKYDANDKAFALFDKLRDYTIFTTDNSECVSLFEWLDSVRVIDLTLYPDDTKKVIVSLILDLFYAEMRQLGGSKQENGFREMRAMIMVDEAHQFLKKDFNSFRSIISEGRMFGVGMILSTQNISDFKTSQEDYSQFILSWVIHHVNSISKSEIASIFGASDSNGDKYMDFINKARIFESVCKIGSKVEAVRDLPFFELVKKDERFIKDNPS